jgi:hypothetical protein
MLIASYFTHILPDLPKELQPIQMSSPGACRVVSSRSTVFELSAMKYWVVSSMTLLQLARAGLDYVSLGLLLTSTWLSGRQFATPPTGRRQ